MPEFYLATVTGTTASGVKIRLDGESAAMTKAYKFIATGVALSANDRVLCIKIAGTFVVLGKITN